ncbi:ABC transporter ATP-binding protein [Paeniglutamicibacter psychrophenolicus]|uniref:ABC-type glutathione transport system ATPase component n=1 Tax=Paeniglutamicibacter psychrophenolicus TaxID=257454 RepID=A0ABS4W826_9MICC|nr:ABC transporter ATP-binding protein [Paeniglutamicibacter psychrophenolicus]MBP2372325.1 ABC-type glutathione transport system ATPase component [Paeniglutamicibacter psychrophenolicus]
MSTIDSAPALLDIRGLSITYGHGDEAVVAAENIDLALRPGEIVALVGESGSGKSTLSKAIIGLLPESARILDGSIDLAGGNLLDMAAKELESIRGRRIGMVPQDPGASLDPVKTVGSQISEVFRLHPQGRKRSKAQLRAEVIRLLELVGIDTPEQRIGQYPHELSGGLKQRVLIAIAFALEPELLIADEPTSALDVTVQQTILEVFTKLARELGTAVIFVTHDLAVATDIADRIVVMQHGRIREDRPVREILRAPEDPYTRMLLTEATASGDGSRTTGDARGIEVPAIEVAGLGKIFGSGKTERAAVDEVSFAVRPGTTFSLVGESGSGKSTTARMIMRLLEPTAGIVKIHGQDVTHVRGAAKRELWRSLQLVYQNPDSALDPRYSVSRIISEPLENYKVGSKAERRIRVAELLDAVNLPSRMAALGAKELSGGQRQRVAIARALALGAKTLVLDEALSALDVLTQAQILALLEDLQINQGLSYLFISHDLHVVERISHDVGVMRQGRLVEVGAAAQVLNSPASEYTRLLLDSNPGALLREMATN